MFRGSCKGVSGVSVCSSKEVLRGVTENFNGVSRKFKGCFEKALKVFQGSFREISRVNQNSLKGILTKIEGCLN